MGFQLLQHSLNVPGNGMGAQRQAGGNGYFQPITLDTMVEK